MTNSDQGVHQEREEDVSSWRPIGSVVGDLTVRVEAQRREALRQGRFPFPVAWAAE